MNLVRNAAHAVAAAALACGLLGAGDAVARDDNHERLAARFDQLASDPVLGSRAPAAMSLARATLVQLEESPRRDREHWAYVADRRIAAARASAEAEYLESQRDELQRTNDRLQLALARRDAAQARAELERQRLQAQIRAEEVERMRVEAEAARFEGEQASQAADSARAEAEQAKRIARAQAKAAALAKKEAELAAAMEDQAGETGKPAESNKPASRGKK